MNENTLNLGIDSTLKEYHKGDHIFAVDFGKNADEVITDSMGNLLVKKCGKSSVFAVAFEAQKLKRAPMEDTDIPMDAVITEKNIYKAKGEL